MEQPPLPTEQRKFRPLVERTWAGTELSLPRGATSMLGAARCHGFGGGYRQSVPPSAMPMLGACKSLLPEQSKQRDAKNARFSNLSDRRSVGARLAFVDRCFDRGVRPLFACS